MTPAERVSREHAREFWAYLTETYPVPAGIKISLELKDAGKVYCKGVPECDKDKITAAVHHTSKSAAVTIAVKGRPGSRIMASIAHEYKHIMQKFIEGRELQSGYDSQTEVEAREFGRTEPMKFILKGLEA